MWYGNICTQEIRIIKAELIFQYARSEAKRYTKMGQTIVAAAGGAVVVAVLDYIIAWNASAMHQ